MKVESEGNEDRICAWLDLEVIQLIALCAKMEPEFVRNGKK